MAQITPRPLTAVQILAKLLTVDTDASGLNATTLQGNAPSAFDSAGLAASTLAAHVALADPHTQYELESANTAAAILVKLLTVDGSGSGLDADTLDGHDTSFFLAASIYTAADILAKLVTLDGSGSGLDADFLDGHDAAFFLTASTYTAADILAKLLTVDGGGSGIDADLLDGINSIVFLPRIDTRANVLASTPTAAQMAFCTDTLEFALWTGSTWYFAPLEMDTDPSGPDIGAYNSYGLGVSDKQGYYRDTLTDKIIHNSVIGENARTVTGAIRTSGSELQFYLAGAWAAITTGFRFFQDVTYQVGELEYRPLGYVNYYGVMNGNGNDVGFNGLPLVQQYAAGQGVYPAKLVIDGGSFS